MIMKAKIFYILFLFFFIVNVHLTAYGNTNAEEYCQELLDSAKGEYFSRNYIESLEILTKLQPTIQENNFVKMEILRLSLIGFIYVDLLAYDEAMEYFLKVYELGIKHNNLSAESAALINISAIYWENNDFDKVIEYLEKAYEVSLKMNDSIRIIEVAINMTHTAIKTKNLSLAEQYVNLALNIQTDDKRSLIYRNIAKVDFLLLKKEYNLAESLGLSILEEKDIELRAEISLLLLLSKIYQHQGNFEKGVYYINESLKKKPTLKEKIRVYEQLSELYYDAESFVLAWQYKDSVVQAKDLLHKISNKQYKETNRIYMELLNSEKQLAENKVRQKSERILLISILVFITILAIVLIWIFRIRSVKNKQQKIITELKLKEEKNEKLLLTKQYNEEKIIALLEQSRLNNEIDAKNRQLIGKALSQSNRNELIKEIIYTLSRITPDNADTILRMVILQLKTQLKDSAKDEGLFVYFEQVNPNFLSALKREHPDLLANDIRLLSFFYLNLNTKEIATLLNILPDSLKKKKQRLASKLGVETGDLYKYLTNLS